MRNRGTILVGTVGQGVMRNADGGEMGVVAYLGFTQTKNSTVPGSTSLCSSGWTVETKPA